MDVTGAHPVKTLFLVTPSDDASDPAWASVARHLDAMQAAFERVIVITPDEPSESGSNDPWAAIEDVYEGRDRETVIVVLDDVSLLAQVRCEFSDRAPVLWWSSQVPTAKSIAAAARWADGVAALARPDGGTGSVPLWIVGAGLDLDGDVAEAPPRPPLELLALGRTAPSKGLITAIRAVAAARSNGIDARLRIVGPATSAVEHSYRRALGGLIRDIALTSVVTIHDAIAPREVPTAMAGAYALIDASIDGDLRHASLEALAAGRPVLTSNRTLAELVPSDELTLSFDSGDAAQLAQRIGLLAELGPASLTRFADAARTNLAPTHARSSLTTQWADAVAAVHGLVTKRAASAARSPGEEDLPAADAAPATRESWLDPAGVVGRFLDAWAHGDAERALADCAPVAFRFGTAADGTGGRIPIADYLLWAAQTADALVSTVEDVDVIDDRTVVTVRLDRWTVGDDQLAVTVRSLFELEDELITDWSETELRVATPSADTAGPEAAENAGKDAGKDALEPKPPEPEPDPETEPDAAARAAFVASGVARVAAMSAAMTATPTTVDPPSANPTAAPALAVPLPPPRDLAEVSASDAAPVPVATTTDSALTELEQSEERVHHWRRQALIWRERALEARALGEAYKENVEDLRKIVEVLKRQAAAPARGTQPDPGPAPDGGASPQDPDTIRWKHDDPGSEDAAAETAAETAADGTDDTGPPAVVPTPGVGDTAAVPARVESRGDAGSRSSGTSMVPARRTPETIYELSTRLARQARAFTRSFGKR